MARYASNTTVPVAKTRAEIEDLVTRRYGAEQYWAGYDKTVAIIGFTMSDRQVRFAVKLPSPEDEVFTKYKDRYGSTKTRSKDAVTKEWEQTCRSIWRALLLVIKAKLEAVEAEISTFEDEFMAHIVMPDGRTVSEHVRPRIASAYDTGDMPPLLPNYGGHP